VADTGVSSCWPRWALTDLAADNPILSVVTIPEAINPGAHRQLPLARGSRLLFSAPFSAWAVAQSLRDSPQFDGLATESPAVGQAATRAPLFQGPFSLQGD